MMNLYFYNNNGVVQGPQTLPQNFGNISGFEFVDDATLNANNWFLFVDTAAPAYDPTTQSVSFVLTLDAVANVVNKVWTINTLSAADQTAYAATQATILSNAKNSSKDIVDAKAENVRLRYITGGAGQAAIYVEKGLQAEAYVAAGYPVDLTNYPFIQAEVNVTGNTATVCANNLVTQKTSWIIKGAQIEQQRLLGKNAIDAATDLTTVDSARLAALANLDTL